MHYLLLKERHSQRFFQDRDQARMRILYRFLPAPAAKIRMDHAAGNRPGPHDAYFDDEIIEVLRPKPWEHLHLRPALDLKNAHRIGSADHLEGLRGFGGELGQWEIREGAAFC